jgi:probable phosphoglycerate mutase
MGKCDFQRRIDLHAEPSYRTGFADAKLALMAATRMLLVRHGATTSSAENRYAGATDVELSAEGVEQVRRLARRLAKERIAAAYCSPLKRANASATALAAAHGLDPIVDPALREIDHGPWEGLTAAEIEQRYPDDYAAWSRDPFDTVIGRDSGRAVLERALPAIERIVREHAGQTVLVVSHKATIRLVIAKLMGMDPRRYRDRLTQDLACLNILEFRAPDSAKLLLFNDTSHCG